MGRIARSLCLLLAPVTLAACLLAVDPLHQAPAARMVVENPQDELTATWEGDRLIVDVVSPTGIGQAAVELAGSPRPQSVVLRFHLAGLEQLEFAYADTVITVSLLNTGDQDVLEQVVKPSMTAPEPVTPGSDYWMEVAVSPPLPSNVQRSDGQPSKPQVIEVSAPADFFHGEHRSFSMAWIDFYR